MASSIMLPNGSSSSYLDLGLEELSESKKNLVGNKSTMYPNRTV